jgi:hypothetical protein
VAGQLGAGLEDHSVFKNKRLEAREADSIIGYVRIWRPTKQGKHGGTLGKEYNLRRARIMFRGRFSVTNEGRFCMLPNVCQVVDGIVFLDGCRGTHVLIHTCKAPLITPMWKRIYVLRQQVVRKKVHLMSIL